jgi:hypothetical protein
MPDSESWSITPLPPKAKSTPGTKIFALEMAARLSVGAVMLRLQRSPHSPTQRRLFATRLIAAAVALGLSACGPTTKQSDQRPSDAWPTQHWSKSKPAIPYLHEQPLATLQELMPNGFVTRYGRQVHAWGEYARKRDVASACKVILPMLAIKAVQAGKLPSLQSPISDIEPGLQAINQALGYKDRQIQWTHLLTQTSCYGVTEAPGTAFDYNDHQSALLSDLLVTKVFATPWADASKTVLGPYLTDPIQCEDFPTYCSDTAILPLGRLQISLRDLCRIGLLVMHHGRWDQTQVLPTQAVHKMLQSPLALDIPRTKGIASDMLPGQRSLGGGSNYSDHHGCYSDMWWINGIDRQGHRHWPDAPADTFAALGFGGGRALVVIPSLSIVASWSTGRGELRDKGRDLVNRCMKQLTQAAGIEAPITR